MSEQTEPMSERDETPESMYENPLGGCRGMGCAALAFGVVVGIVLAILRWRGVL